MLNPVQLATMRRCFAPRETNHRVDSIMFDRGVLLLWQEQIVQYLLENNADATIVTEDNWVCKQRS
jgi:hypothetical protein